MPTAEQFRAAAARSLASALRFRKEAKARCSHFDRKIDRRIMRTYALQWREYRAKALKAQPAAA